LAAGNIVEIDNLLTAYLPTNALRTITTFTATAAQTTFSVSYTQGLIDVFYNGSNLAQSEYTATNGTSIILATACQLNDIVVVYAYTYSVGAYSGIGGSGTTNYVAKFSSSSAITNSLIFDNGTNVGIGTASPYAIATRNVTMEDPSGTDFALSFGLNGTRTGQIYTSTAQVRLSSVTNIPLLFSTNDTERMRITSTGNVTINGAIETYSKLNIKPTNNQIYGGAAFYSTDGTETFLGIGNVGTACGLLATYGATGSYIPMTFSTGGSERMRITSGGEVGIGVTPTTGNRFWVKGSSTSSGNTTIVAQNSAGTNLFYLRDDGSFNTGTAAASPYNNTYGNAANVYIGSDGFMGRSTSSLKYKENVKDYSKGLDEVMQLRAVSYTSKNTKEEGQTFAGLIAEEVHEIGLTEFVQYTEDGTPDALAYSNMIALLTKAIQEMNTKIIELEKIVATK